MASDMFSWVLFFRGLAMGIGDELKDRLGARKAKTKLTLLTSDGFMLIVGGCKREDGLAIIWMCLLHTW